VASETPTSTHPSWLRLEALAASWTAPSAAVEPLCASLTALGFGSCQSGRDFVACAARQVFDSYASQRPPLPRCARLRAQLGMPRQPHGRADGNVDIQSAFEDATWLWLCERENAEQLRAALGTWKADVEENARRLLALEHESNKQLQGLRTFQETLRVTCAQGAERSSVHLEKHGSKLAGLVHHVRRLQAEDAECKIICFVQWEDLKRKIAAALEEFGVEHLTLGGSVWSRRSTLKRFQYDTDSPRLLLLSLEDSASGTNLTASNHVIMVHPMEAATREEAVAFEMQAVGRVRRPGQLRKIHIWRFVTEGTVEQEITEVHRKELWERQHAASSPPPLQPNLEGLADESDIEALETAAGDQAAAELELPLVVFAGMETQPCVLPTQPCGLPTQEGFGESNGIDKLATAEEDSFVVTTQEAGLAASAPWTGTNATPGDATQPCKGPTQRPVMPEERRKGSKRDHGAEMCTERKRGRRAPVRCKQTES